MIRLFRIFIPVSTFTLVLADFFLTCLSYIAASYLMFEVDPTDYLLYDNGMLAIMVVTTIFLMGAYFNGMYSELYVKSKINLLYQLSLITGLTFVVEGLFSSEAAALELPIRVMIVGAALSATSIFAWRLFFSQYAIDMLGHAGVLLVGTDPAVEAVAKYINSHPQSGFRVMGYLDENESPGESMPGIKKLGHAAALPEMIRALQPSRVVVRLNRTPTIEFSRLLEELRYAGQNIDEAADMYEKVCGRVWLRGIQPVELIYSSRFGAPLRSLMMQRMIDVLLSIIAFIVLLPLMLLTWGVLKLHVPGHVLQREERMGIGRTRFLQYRFRLPCRCASMEVSEGRLLTIIRKFHLDGLPQLINVLKGDMSMVGPRADRPEFAEELAAAIPFYPQRRGVRPGMTGWAQIQDLPRAADALAALGYDLYYIKYMSLSLDTIIAAQTLRTMFVEEPE